AGPPRPDAPRPDAGGASRVGRERGAVRPMDAESPPPRRADRPAAPAAVGGETASRSAAPARRRLGDVALARLIPSSFFHPFFRRSLMARTLTVCALLLSWPLTPGADDPPKPSETVIRLTVTPMAAPKPALRYALLPELSELTPGNPIQGYMKCFMEQNHFFFNKDSVANREKWQTMALKDLPMEHVRGYGGKALQRADDS